jgi:hypothetical protein
LTVIAKSKRSAVSKDVFILRGLWLTHYILRLDERATTFNLHYVQAQTLGQGCSYFEPAEEKPDLSEALLGEDVLELNTDYRCIKIAALDAVFSSLNRTPSESVTLEGRNVDKNTLRADIVIRESYRLLNKRTPKSGRKYKVVNVGVVGNFLHLLSQRGDLEICATDFYEGVVGKRVHGVEVQHGRNTPRLVGEADVAIVTGMTLANKTLEQILEVALENGTRLVMFAETGSHFASEYCKLGVDSVVSEPFPFYLSSEGRTQIDIYRRD